MALACTLALFAIVGTHLSVAEARRPRGTLLVLGLEAEGFAAADVEALDAAIRAEAGEVSSLQLLPRPALDTASMALSAGCEGRGTACLVAIGKTLSVTMVLEATLTGDSSAATLTLKLVRVSNGRDQSLTRTLTDVAGESAAEVRVYVANLFGKKRELPPGSIALVVARGGAELSDTRIRLDDKAATEKDLKRVSPGSHRLELTKVGHQAFLWQGQVHAGRETKVQVLLEPLVAQKLTPPPKLPDPAVDLTPKPKDAPPPDEAQPKVAAKVETDSGGPRIFTWILSGGAVAAGVVGAVFGVQKLSLDSEISQAQDVRNEACRAGDVASCNRSVCDDTLAEDCGSADTKATVATVAWVMAGAFAVGAVAAFFVETPDEPAFEGAVIPRVGGGDVALRVRF
jgi:hypothetical protein